jgi:hypothetical protein
MSVIQDLHDSQLEFSLIAGHTGFQVRLGGERPACEAQLESFRDAQDWLVGAALAHHPDSAFAFQYRDYPHRHVFDAGGAIPRRSPVRAERREEAALNDTAPTADAPTS